MENLHSSKLFVGNGEHSDLSIVGQGGPYAILMDDCILFTGAMPDIYRKLHHYKPILY